MTNSPRLSAFWPVEAEKIQYISLIASASVVVPLLII
jgi:hypothetical protein